MRRGLRSSEGLTVVELMVSLMIMGVVLSGLSAAAIGVWRATSTVTLTTDDQNQARTAMTVLSRDIRAAAPLRPSDLPAFHVAQPNRAEFTANLDSATRPQLIRIYVDADSRMVEDAIAPNDGSVEDGTFGWDPDDARVRYIASYVVNDVNEPLLRYFDGDTELLPADPAVGLTLEQRRRINLVEVSVRIGSSPSQRVGAFQVSQRIRLPNAGTMG